MAYSEDIREKAVRMYEAKGNAAEVAERLCIGRDTLVKWIELKRNTGSIKPKKPPGMKPKIQEDELLRYLEVYPEATYQEIGENFRTTDSTAHRACVRYGITHKKNSKIQRKR